MPVESCSLDIFEAVQLAIFANLWGMENAAVHDYVNPRRQNLDCGHGRPDVKGRIAQPESGRLHGACEHDCLFGYAQKKLCRSRHGVRSVG